MNTTYETDLYKIVVNEDHYEVVNKKYGVVEKETKILPEAIQVMDFFTTAVMEEGIDGLSKKFFSMQGEVGNKLDG